ncbi:MAG: hypothetical protein QOD03_1472 [Verrucomicrobiota bacterium]
MERSEFISRFLYQIRDDEFYGNPGSPPTASVIQKVSTFVKDELGFEAYRTYFITLADILDVCVAEEIAARGSGIAARNASKHPRVVELSKLDSEQRAGISSAAAQGLAWYEQCEDQNWLQDHSLRNQINKRVMTAIIVAVGRIKKGYTQSQLAALARVGISLQTSDTFALRARGAIVEILAGNFINLPRDEDTLTALRSLLDRIASQPNAAPVFQAMDKLHRL